MSRVAAFLPETAKGRRRLMFALRVAMTVAILIALLIWMPVDSLLQAIGKISPALWLAVLAASLLVHLVAALKWRLLLRASGVRSDFLETLHAHLSGLFANLFLPSLVGGDLIRTGLLARRHSLPPLAVGALADRLLDTAALIVLASIGALITSGAEVALAAKVLGVATVALLAIVLLGGLAVGRMNVARLPARLARPAEKLRDAVASLRARPEHALAAFALGLAIQCSYVFLNVWLGRAVGIDVPVSVWLLTWPLAKLISVLPISLGGIGVRETALAFLMGSFGVDPALAVAQSLVWEAVIVVRGLIAGTCALLLGRMPLVAMSAASRKESA